MEQNLKAAKTEAKPMTEAYKWKLKFSQKLKAAKTEWSQNWRQLKLNQAKNWSLQKLKFSQTLKPAKNESSKKKNPGSSQT